MKRIVALLAAVSILGAAAAPPIAFPRDHGSHGDAALEWWYWTGHLSDEDGRAFGFQLTFFRLRDLHLAHFAWSDIAAAQFHFREKTHLALPGIAGAQEGRLDVFNEDWFARDRDGAQELHVRAPEGELALTLSPRKPPVLHGAAGISRKGPGDNEYSRYVSIPRLSVTGSWTVRGRRRGLRGTAWFDHEWGPGALPEGAAGWDWFALQLSDGSELMLYRMRLSGGRASPSARSFPRRGRRGRSPGTTSASRRKRPGPRRARRRPTLRRGRSRCAPSISRRPSRRSSRTRSSSPRRRRA
jgi:predicted secreted hydrolase